MLSELAARLGVSVPIARRLVSAYLQRLRTRSTPTAEQAASPPLAGLRKKGRDRLGRK